MLRSLCWASSAQGSRGAGAQAEEEVSFLVFYDTNIPAGVPSTLQVAFEATLTLHVYDSVAPAGCESRDRWPGGMLPCYCPANLNMNDVTSELSCVREVTWHLHLTSFA